MVSPTHTVLQRETSLKILLAEDNLTNQKLTLRQLRILGYEADFVGDGQAAVNAVMQSPYDVVLMDCQMPVLDGFDATLAIREWEHHQQHDGTLRSPIVIIALTASTLEQDWGRALSIGMNDYLIKPIYKEVLSTLLDRWQQVIFTQSEGASTRDSDSNSLPHLDLDHLHRLSDNQPEFELELLKLFWEDNALHLKTLQQAIDRQDFSQIQRSAHHIKGASASVGAKRMQFLAEQLENQSYPASGTITAELMAKLEFSLAQIGLYLKQWEEWGMGNG